MASTGSSSQEQKHKDPNAPDFEKIVLPKKYKVYNRKADAENLKWIDFQNQLRECRNNYLEAAKSLQGKERSSELKKYVDEFHRLFKKIDQKMENVKKAGGTPAPLERHLTALPSLGGQKVKK